MLVEADTPIDASTANVWATITDIEHSADSISGIERIEMIDAPTDALVGRRWRETRILFGKPATVEKWITDAVDHVSYTARAESDGFVFLSTRRIAERGAGVVLTEIHESLPQTFATKLQAVMMMLFFKGTIRKAILQDLRDIKTAAERR